MSDTKTFTSIATANDKVKPRQLNNGDSFQQEFEVDFHQNDVQETNMPTMRPLALVENKYIVALGLDGVFIIDFHAAHERVMPND